MGDLPDRVPAGRVVGLQAHPSSRHQTSGKAEERLAAIRAAAAYSFPTADIDGILAEIERGYVE